MDQCCKKVLQPVAEAERLKEDQNAIVEKLKEIKAVIQQMKEITSRARS